MSFIGLDIGTTCAKALIVDEHGCVLGKGSANYPLISSGCNVEQRADDWSQGGTDAIKQALLGLDASDINAVSLSTQGASLVAIDSDGAPIGNALTWMDTRAQREADTLRHELGDDYVYHNTGWRINPALDAAKILYMKRSGNYNRASLYLSTLEYMNLFLTGNPVCDPSNSSIRQLYNISNDDYDDEILKVIGSSRSELPEVIPAGELVGYITSSAAAATGLLQGTPVYNGAHDQYCASLGSACVNSGDLLLSAGTTWVVMGISDSLLFTNTYTAPGVHPITGLYGVIASLVGGGSSLQWFKNNFINEDFDSITFQASSRVESTRSLFFYPYLSGAYYPTWNANARGAFCGIELQHDKYDFARAIMEASAFGVRNTLENFAASGFQPKNLSIMGGAAKSSVWCSLIASAANLPVKISGESEACSLGAAIIAAKGSGVYASFEDAVKAITPEKTCLLPDPALVDALADKYTEYNRMWDGVAMFYQ